MTTVVDSVSPYEHIRVLRSGSEHPPEIRLSPRELQVLSHIASGHTSEQTSRRLGISRSTVETYLHRLRSKLKTPSRAHLIRIAVHLGL